MGELLRIAVVQRDVRVKRIMGLIPYVLELCSSAFEENRILPRIEKVSDAVYRYGISYDFAANRANVDTPTVRTSHGEVCPLFFAGIANESYRVDAIRQFCIPDMEHVEYFHTQIIKNRRSLGCPIEDLRRVNSFSPKLSAAPNAFLRFSVTLIQPSTSARDAISRK